MNTPNITTTWHRASRQTLVYSKDHEGQYLDNFPIISGMKCTGWSARDLFEDYEEAVTVLAQIATRGCGEAEKLANAFFERKKETPYSYYDPDDEEEEV